MALELVDDDSFNGTITNDGTESLTVNARTADVFELLIDDTTGSAPASYDVTVEIYSTAEDSFIRADEVTGVTTSSPDVIDTARGQQVKITLTNQSGAGEDYRISLESYKEI